MDAHALALVQWAGPTILTVFGVVICFALRAVYNSFEKLLRRNDDEHQQIFIRLREQERKAADLDARQSEGARKDSELSLRGDRQEQLIHEQGERLSKVEIKVEMAHDDIEKLRGSK